MKIGSMASYKDDEPSYVLYYALTIICGLALAYFLILGGRFFRFLFLLSFQYWWVVLIIVLIILFFRMRRGRKKE